MLFLIGVYIIYRTAKDIQTVNINSRRFSLSPLYQTGLIFSYCIQQEVYDRQNITRRLVKDELVPTSMLGLTGDWAGMKRCVGRGRERQTEIE